jgi:hypothetical protein
MRAVLYLSSILAATASDRPPRQISWWWTSPDAADDPGVDGLLTFCSDHRSIITTVIMNCGVHTCERNSSTHRPNATCLNNGGIGGKLTGNLSAACLRAIPKLTELGIRTELWLGEDDSMESAKYLFAHPEQTAADLLALARAHPAIKGFNLDLEPGRGIDRNSSRMAAFLGVVSKVLGERSLRFSADVGCTASTAQADCLTCDCAALSRSGVHRLMDMSTYNALDYEEWLYAKAAPSIGLEATGVIGHGLGCWIDAHTNGTDHWSVTATSAEQRVCYLMNQSATEIDMFTIKQDAKARFPEPFWIAPLEKFMSGGSCVAELPMHTKCPKATVGPPDSWQLSDEDKHCCISSARRGPDAVCNKACAEAECAADPGMFWKPENYSIHPYECCRR